jgi:hypothetical protein
VIQNIFSKIIEKVFAARPVIFFITIKFIDTNQYTYLKGKSVELAIFNFLSAIYDSLECSKNCADIFYDFSKPFDMVQHEILFKKLSSLRANGKTLEFVRFYLLDRRYYVGESDVDGNIVDMNLM